MVVACNQPYPSKSRSDSLIAAPIAIVVLMVSDRVDINERYVVKAYLPNADGLLVGSPVSLAGIRVGNVTDIKPDTTGRNAILVKMEIIASYDIPSSAELTLATAGFSVMPTCHLLPVP